MKVSPSMRVYFFLCVRGAEYEEQSVDRRIQQLIDRAATLESDARNGKKNYQKNAAFLAEAIAARGFEGLSSRSLSELNNLIDKLFEQQFHYPFTEIRKAISERIKTINSYQPDAIE